MEEFADFLRELQSDTSDSNDNRANGKKNSRKKSKKANDNLTSQFLENQQLSFQLASDVRSLRQQLADEKQSKRLLATNNVNLEAQMQKLEQKQVTLEQALRISENRRIELQSKYEEERKLRTTLQEEKHQWQVALQAQRTAVNDQTCALTQQQAVFRQMQQDHEKLTQYTHALELAFNEVVAENAWQKQLVSEVKEENLKWEVRVEQTERRLQLFSRQWMDTLAPFDSSFASDTHLKIDKDGTIGTEKCMKLLQKLLSRTQLRMEKLERRRRRSQAHVKELLHLVAELEDDLQYYQHASFSVSPSSSTVSSPQRHTTQRETRRRGTDHPYRRSKTHLRSKRDTEEPSESEGHQEDGEEDSVAQSVSSSDEDCVR